jgi:hypothetical protein
LRSAVIPRAALLANAGCRAFGLLHGRLLNECLRLTVQVLHLGIEGAGMACSSVASSMSF